MASAISPVPSGEPSSSTKTSAEGTFARTRATMPGRLSRSLYVGMSTATRVTGSRCVIVILVLFRVWLVHATAATGTTYANADTAAEAEGEHRQQRTGGRSEEHTSELQSRLHLVCRLLLEKKKKNRQRLLTQKKKNKNKKQS